MDVFTMLDGQNFVWDSHKAAANFRKHGVRSIERAKCFWTNLHSTRMQIQRLKHGKPCIGLTSDLHLLYVVRVIREGDLLRLISARVASAAERTRYEDG